jgi:hypothetical protein
MLVIDKLDTDEVLLAAEDCRRQIVLFASRRGFTRADLVTRCTRMRQLDEHDRERVLVLLAKMRQVSCHAGPHHALHFYPRNLAPEGAFNIEQVKKRGHST